MKSAEIIKERFIQRYKDKRTELNFNNDYELLVAIILSAQCTDKRVNLITPNFFKKYPDIKSLANAKIEDVKELIKSCNFFNNKAKNLINMAKSALEIGGIPNNFDDLIKLSGVGQKTANVFLIEYYNKDLMAVDTHVFRVSHRLGLSNAKDTNSTQKDLEKIFVDNLNILHQAMVLFGRYICTAKNPKCNQCFVKEFCREN